MTALFVNQLTTLDFSYLSPERGVVGETWLVDVVLKGNLDEQGMVFDFGHVKKQIKASLDLLADHRLLVPTAHQALTIKADNEERLSVQMQTSSGDIIECKAPAQAILLVNAQEITPQALTPFLEKTLLDELPDNVSGVELQIYPEQFSGAFYHYSHGLKKHLGDCQRIAHGHRSPIHIYLNGQRDPMEEAGWAETWKDIYIATREDLLETVTLGKQEHFRFGYTSDQGYFELTIAEDRCYLIDTDSTVELLAEHIASMLKSRHPDQSVRVVAFEGFNKGAVAEK
ncbi:6-carboxytetrahydropterin synthase [Endozoicomonas numazuensis]|uniref:6-carboxy-5,6,7,8-tetrahydropterin synthase n=1 Tax=Endozoicomonas numazuensis TaxID=1137799 RepID=A0A081NL01_9GAMM|nr:6-carboxytetrahydropterin synthase [Endozoicomonas numazuensis]KEQ19124.1 6-pyruvoyl tetrahydropterin reductase [Endozoicomonas numazuensis]